MFRWITSKYGDLVPLVVFLTVVGLVYAFDREQRGSTEADRQRAMAEATRKASLLSDAVRDGMSLRIGAMAAAEFRLTPVQDAVSQRTLAAALDTVTAKYQGLVAVSIVYPDGTISRGRNASLGERGADPLVDTAVGNAFRRVQRTRQDAATAVVDLPVLGRRVYIFHPVIRDSSRLVGYLAGEVDPTTVARIALQPVQDSVAGSFWSILGPTGDRISGVPARADWPAVERTVKIADTEWVVRLAYAPPQVALYKTQRIVTWVVGLFIAFALAAILLILRQTISKQGEEIARRQAAEDAARISAAEAKERAREARELAAQLESAQRTAQRLSTSLNPDDVVELFLGSVAEIVDADVASLYTFEEEGEVLVGRRRIVFRNVGAATERLKSEDIRQVRAPVALLPSIAEALATGEPQVEIGQSAGDGRPVFAVSGSAEAAASTITLPLLIAGHMVGVATWEVYGESRRFNPATIAFAQAMSAPAAAALRTAELFSSLEDERARAHREALRFAAVLDQMADGVVVVDATGRVELYNKAAEELLGEDLEHVPLEDWSTTFNMATVEGRPLTGPEFPLARALKGDRIRRATFIVRSSWGTERHLSCSAGPIITRDGQATGAAMVLRDVSDEHQYAEMLRHTNRELRRQAEVLEGVNRQLRDATKAKDQFVAVMSHELRTPINAIMGYSDLLDLGVKGDLNADQRAMVVRVRETSRHLLGLINEVLDLAKIGAGRMDLVLVELEIGTIVERAVQQILPMATAKRLSLTTTMIPGPEHAFVIADETRLTQIVINLLSNAVKFTQSGTVTVKYGVVGDQVEIHVKDTGPGIPKEQRERIFEEFYQVESGLSRTSGGTGLGLAIARRFAHLMGGDIRVESEMGHGSEFVVTLPSSNRLAIPAATDKLPTAVLLASAEDEALRITAELSATVHVLATIDPVRAVAVARSEEAQAVVLDASAAELAAWRALNAVQLDPASSDLRVALFARDGDSMDALDLGCFRLLTKPFLLQRAVDLLLGMSATDAGCILVADDDPHVRRILTEALGANGRETVAVADVAAAEDAIQAEVPQAAVIDLLLPGDGRGLGLLALFRSREELSQVPLVVLVGRGLSPEEMQQLDEALESVALSGVTAIRPITEIIKAAAAGISEPQSALSLAQPLP